MASRMPNPAAKKGSWTLLYEYLSKPGVIKTEAIYLHLR